MNRSGLRARTRAITALTAGTVLAVSGAVLGPAAATHGRSGYHPPMEPDGHPGDDYGLHVEPGPVPGSGEFLIYCGIDTCATEASVLGRPLAGFSVAPPEDWAFGAMVYPYECLAPGTVGWAFNDSELLVEPIVTPGSVPDTGPLPEECGNPAAFVDMETTGWLYDEVAWAAEQGITHGWSDGTFRPLEPITRYAVAAFLYRMAGFPEPDQGAYYTEPFVDVAPGDPFHHEISWMAEAGITHGWADGTFRPMAPTTRGMMAAFIYRMAGSPEHTPPEASPFVDVDPSHDFYQEISWLADEGITHGWSDGTFRPAEPVNREAAAAFLARYAGAAE
jgi:hypothetical protein